LPGQKWTLHYFYHFVTVFKHSMLLASKFVDHNSTTSVHINRKVFENWNNKLLEILTGGSEIIVNQT